MTMLLFLEEKKTNNKERGLQIDLLVTLDIL